MIDCSSFLEGYSDYRDGLLPREEREFFEAHLRDCASCARYDRVITGGVRVFRELPEPSPSGDFELHLWDRLRDAERDRRHRPRESGVSVAVTLTIAMAIGATAWLPAFRSETAITTLPPVLAQAPRPADQFFPSFGYRAYLTPPILTSANMPSAGEFSPYSNVPFKALVSYSSAWVPSFQH